MKDPQPRVLFLDHAAVLGGAELSMLDLARHCAQRASVVLFQDGPFRKLLDEVGVSVRVIAAPGILDVSREGSGARLRVPGALLSAALRLVPAVMHHDVVHCNSQKAFVTAAPVGRLVGRPVVWHLRDILSEEHFSPFMRRLAIRTANHFAARVICNSEATADAFVASGGSSKSVRVLYNGIDAMPFDHAQPQSVRSDLGLKNSPVVGCFSRISPWKGQHVFIHALARLPHVQGLIVGEPLFGEEAYAERLRRDVDALGLSGRIHFAGFRRDVPDLMALCDVIVHTSVAAEPFGRVIVEGMLSGRPVVATDAGGAREIVTHGVTGLLVPPGDVGALAAALKQVLTSEDRGRAMAECGRAEARTRFNRDRMLAGFDELLREVAMS